METLGDVRGQSTSGNPAVSEPSPEVQSPDTHDTPDTQPLTSDPAVELLNAPIGDSKMTFLHLAGREGHAEVVTTLLSEGADPSIRSVLNWHLFC